MFDLLLDKELISTFLFGFAPDMIMILLILFPIIFCSAFFKLVLDIREDKRLDRVLKRERKYKEEDIK